MADVRLVPNGESAADVGAQLRALSAKVEVADNRKGPIVGEEAKAKRDATIIDKARKGYNIFEIMKCAGTNAPHAWRVIEAARKSGDLPPVDPLIDPRAPIAGVVLVAFEESEWKLITKEAARRKYKDPQFLIRAIALTVAHDNMFEAVLGDGA